MTEQQIRIERVKLADLPALARQLVQAAWPGGYIPITIQRAEALTHNPFADPDDVAMLVARRGEECVGYFGIMPVRIYFEGQAHKVHWFTTWSVHPTMLGQGLGSQLMEEALELDLDFAIVGSKPARRVCAHFGFEELAPLIYAQIDLRIARRYNPLTLLLRTLRKLLSLFGLKVNIKPFGRPLDRLFDGLFGWLLRPLARLMLLSGSEKALRGFSVQSVERVSGGSEESDIPHFYRNEDIVNWMLAHPWVLPEGESQSEQLDYAFTDTRQGFEQFALQLEQGSQPAGYAVFQFSLIAGARTLKVLDFALPGGASQLLALAGQAAIDRRVEVIEGPLELGEALSSDFARSLLLEERQRIYQVMPRTADSPLGRAWPHLQLSYVDGDTPFT